MHKSKYKAVIYDCDGVMFDSMEANFAFYQMVLDHCGAPSLDRHDSETMRVLHTYSNRDVLAYLFPDQELRKKGLAFASTIDYRDLVPFMRMEEDFLKTLDLLRDRVGLAVCTNRSTSMEMLLRDFNLAPYFGCVVTAAVVSNPKPHPEPLQKVLTHYGIKPHEALFIGDSEVDRLAAQAASVPFIAYKNDLAAMARIERHLEILPFVFDGEVTG